jgi:anthranilate phosphoribosyltransferase
MVSGRGAPAHRHDERRVQAVRARRKMGWRTWVELINELLSPNHEELDMEFWSSLSKQTQYAGHR